MALPADARHSPDFCSIVWNGERLVFSAMQAAIVRVLWQALANGTPCVRGSTLLEAAGSNQSEDRLDPLFFRHAAWKTLIVRGDCRGSYKLDPDAFRQKSDKIA